MRPVLLAVALVLGPTAAAGAANAASPRHYDCTKAANANKAACKVEAASAAPASQPTPTVAAAPAKAARTYDCSKAGNKSKAACKATLASTATATPLSSAAPAPAAKPTPVLRTAAAPAATSGGGSPRMVAWTEKNGKVVHYDCSKAGNLNKKACKA